MCATLILLTITLYFQVSLCKHLHSSACSGASAATESFQPPPGTGLLGAILQHGPDFHLHFLFCQRTGYVSHSPLNVCSLTVMRFY